MVSLLAVGINEGWPVDAIIARPGDHEADVSFLEGDGLGGAVASEACGEAIGRVEEPVENRRSWSAVTTRPSRAAARRWM
jgi:hypothetical protein